MGACRAARQSRAEPVPSPLPDPAPGVGQKKPPGHRNPVLPLCSCTARRFPRQPPRRGRQATRGAAPLPGGSRGDPTAAARSGIAPAAGPSGGRAGSAAHPVSGRRGGAGRGGAESGAGSRRGAQPDGRNRYQFYPPPPPPLRKRELILPVIICGLNGPTPHTA